MGARELPSASRRWLADIRATGRFARLQPLQCHRTDWQTAKAWILPDGDAVSIDRWHYEWILTHEREVVDFGLDVGRLPREEDPVRHAAVRVGFWRVNYVIRNGQLTIEGMEDRFTRAVREAVAVVVLESLEQIGFVRLHILQDAVQPEVRRLEINLADIDTPEGKVEALERVVGLSTSTPDSTD